MTDSPQTFWNHLDELRGSIIKMIVAVVVIGVAAFLAKDLLFDIVLAPQRPDFITYRWLDSLSLWFASLQPEMLGQSSSVESGITLINTGLAQQFIIHMRVALYAGIILTSPYIIYLLFHFISPALYQSERRHVIRFVCYGYALFFAGLLLSYFLIFPLTFRFLGTYQVSEVVANTITIDSYISTLTTLSLAMGIVFEIPIICWLLARLGFLTAEMMRRYRRHVVVAILIVAAIITPTSDVFTLTLVSLPMWMLFEVSILIVKRTREKRHITAE